MKFSRKFWKSKKAKQTSKLVDYIVEKNKRQIELRERYEKMMDALGIDLSKPVKLVWLDDWRQAPGPNWIRVMTPEDAIAQLDGADLISLDHDLGLFHMGKDGHMEEDTGFDVLDEIERRWFEDGIEPPLVIIHTQNPVAREAMNRVVATIQRSVRASKAERL